MQGLNQRLQATETARITRKEIPSWMMGTIVVGIGALYLGQTVQAFETLRAQNMTQVETLAARMDTPVGQAARFFIRVASSERAVEEARHQPCMADTTADPLAVSRL